MCSAASWCWDSSSPSESHICLPSLACWLWCKRFARTRNRKCSKRSLANNTASTASTLGSSAQRAKMPKHIRVLLFLPLAAVLVWGTKTQLDSLPQPVSNNAVAALKSGRRDLVFSLMGIGPKKTWDAITSSGYALDTSTGEWTELTRVPGTGRIAAVAAGARGRVFLFGGYVVDAQGNETT